MASSQPITRGNLRFWLACCPVCNIQGEYDTAAAADNHHAHHRNDPPTVPSAPWLQPEDRTGPEWYDKHNERL